MEPTQEPITGEIYTFSTIVEEIEELKDDFGPTMWGLKVTYVSSKFWMHGNKPNLKIGEAVNITITKVFK